MAVHDSRDGRVLVLVLGADLLEVVLVLFDCVALLLDPLSLLLHHLKNEFFHFDLLVFLDVLFYRGFRPLVTLRLLKFILLKKTSELDQLRLKLSVCLVELSFLNFKLDFLLL